MKGALSKLKVPERLSHKGENGKLLIVAGSRKYHGAPALCILGARRFCDLIYFIPGEQSLGVLQQARSIPEVIFADELPEAETA
jgi:NAD(P)H-hydrate repair Nnr-like enzyme with NAD(P)H-hydrate dehydratase domain